jgi:hypothetical protein
MLKLESGDGAYHSDLVIPMKAGLLSAPIIPDTGHWKSTRTRVIPDIFYRESICAVLRMGMRMNPR